MARKYILPPNWKNTFEYHRCDWRNCEEQAAFVFLPRNPMRFQKASEDNRPIELVHLCPRHHGEVAEFRAHLTQTCSVSEVEERSLEFLRLVLPI